MFVTWPVWKNTIGSIVKLVWWDSPSDSDCRYWTLISVSQQEEIAVGDTAIVQKMIQKMILDDKTKRNFRKLVKVEELLPGNDGVVCAVVIKTCSDITNRFQLLRRSVEHPISLEARSSLPVDNESNPALKSKEDMEILPRPGWTRRDAAIAAQLRFVNSLDCYKRYLLINIFIDVRKLFRLFLFWIFDYCKCACQPWRLWRTFRLID